MSVTAISDSQAIALLCAPLPIGDAKPLTTSEWVNVAGAIHRSVGHPGELIGMSAGDLASTLVVDAPLAGRLANLLARGGPFAFELERLAGRGIWLLTRADDEYPSRLKQRLGLRAPPVLFGSGSRELLSVRGIAVVGSRDASEAATELAARVGERLGREEVVVVSGGARGIDRTAMSGAMSVGGSAIGFIADSLLRLSQQTDTRERLTDGQLALVTPFAPDARFAVGNAMMRNKLIYCAAEGAVVVATTAGSGGTWAGAIEALETRWVPVWTWSSPSSPEGNASLVAAGARELTESELASDSLVGTLTSVDAETMGDSGDLASVPSLQSAETRSFLRVPRSEQEIREEFDLRLTKVRSWMKECVESGEVIRRDRPVRYVLRDAEPSLFDPS
jgi:predicted Rossmann fold nucleotide-binding protein DprA/Smf involved in DNA uptake